jgi:tetratricopeptide (TPR) repeat protein
MRSLVRGWFVLVLIASILLCASASVQEKTASYWFEKGNELLESRSYEKAVQAYDEAISIDPEFAEALTAKGIALVGLGKYNDAIECFDKATDVLEYAEAWNNKGLALPRAKASTRRPFWHATKLSDQPRGRRFLEWQRSGFDWPGQIRRSRRCFR